MPRLIVLLVACLASRALAAPGTESARAILDRVVAFDDQGRAWTDRHQSLRLHTYAKDELQLTKELELYERLRLPDGRRGVVAFFTAPADEHGTAVLALAESDGATQQWVYVNWQRRVRQVAFDGRRERVQDTDLTFGDLELLSSPSAWLEREAAVSLGADETIDGVPTRAIEIVSQRTDPTYAKMIVWFGRDDFVPRRIEGWSAAGDLAKRLTMRDIVDMNTVPTARRILVETPADGTRTEIEVVRTAIDVGAPVDRFAPTTLERGPW